MQKHCNCQYAYAALGQIKLWEQLRMSILIGVAEQPILQNGEGCELMSVCFRFRQNMSDLPVSGR